MIEFYSFVVKAWLSLATVKTVMGYYQMPMMVRVLKNTTSRQLSGAEIFQMVILSPFVNLIVLPHYLFKEKWSFFQPYDEAYVRHKFQDMGPMS